MKLTIDRRNAFREICEALGVNPDGPVGSLEIEITVHAMTVTPKKPLRLGSKDVDRLLLGA